MIKIFGILMVGSLLFSESNFVVHKIVSVYDGDTFKINLKCKPQVLCKNLPIRIYGIDTPEKRTKSKKEKTLALEARNLTSFYLMRSKKIFLDDCTRGKYFRLVCKVRNNKGIYISDLLLKANLAVPYFGETKTKDWSK